MDVKPDQSSEWETMFDGTLQKRNTERKFYSGMQKDKLIHSTTTPNWVYAQKK